VGFVVDTNLHWRRAKLFLRWLSKLRSLSRWRSKTRHEVGCLQCARAGWMMALRADTVMAISAARAVSRRDVPRHERIGRARRDEPPGGAGTAAPPGGRPSVEMGEGLADAYDGVAVDELLLAADGVAQRGAGEAIDLA